MSEHDKHCSMMHPTEPTSFCDCRPNPELVAHLEGRIAKLTEELEDMTQDRNEKAVAYDNECEQANKLYRELKAIKQREGTD